MEQGYRVKEERFIRWFDEDNFYARICIAWRTFTLVQIFILIWCIMNWYKTASLIDKVQILSYTGNTLSIFIGDKRYQYGNIEGEYWATQINMWKKWKNKRAAGEKLSTLLRNIEPLIQNKPPVQPKAPKAPQPTQQMDLFNELV